MINLAVSCDKKRVENVERPVCLILWYSPASLTLSLSSDFNHSSGGILGVLQFTSWSVIHLSWILSFLPCDDSDTMDAGHRGVGIEVHSP